MIIPYRITEEDYPAIRTMLADHFHTDAEEWSPDPKFKEVWLNQKRKIAIALAVAQH